ncbi:MAG TPA: sugar ABC transporter ATP-binding protein [Clostridiaceae bacterium]|nr:sugar ABC transporter ATP-binding protein [Clostridiaceae bacterium]
MKDIILSIRNISKSFPGVKALDDVSFDMERGTVHALLGENGAGKSTLIKILAGIYQPDSGEFIFDGTKMHFRTPYESLKAGISVVHQEFKLAETLTVTENIFLGNYIYKKKLVDWKTMREKAANMIGELGVNIEPDDIVANLTVAKKQIVEICKAINHQCRLIIMDEPSATLTDKEIDILYQIINKLKKQGISIIYISHRLEEVFRIADNLTVLRDGRHIGTVPVSEVDRNKLISMMVGRTLEKEYPKEEVKIGEVVLKVKNLNNQKGLKNINFEVRKGEILGIAGLVGSGRTELARAILGIDKISSGEITINGNPVRFKKFKYAIKNSLGLVPEDRKAQGLILPFAVKENVTLVSIKKILKGGVLNKKLENHYAEQYVDRLKIHTPSIDTAVENLSGGNQQKVVIAKWLMENSQIIFLDEPTRGIDVGAKAEIYKLISKMASEGKTVIMISSELPEILGMCDRILVMHEGRIAGMLTREEATQESIINLCV